MPALFERVTFVWSGPMPGGEIWQNGVALRVSAAVDQEHLDQGAETAAGFLDTWWGDLGSIVAVAGLTVNKVRSYYYAAEATAAGLVSEHSINAGFGGSAATAPNQCALVASLRSSVPGMKNQGRIYIPCLNPGSMTGALLSGTTAGTVATATADLLDGLNAIDLYGPVVAGSNGAEVTSVRVDNIVDTQRRRRNRLVATTTANAALGA